MSDRQKSTAPPPSPPQSESDRMLRHTWAWEFDEPEVPELLIALGDKILEYAREGHLWGKPDTWIVPGGLTAIAADLDSLAGCLRELTETPLETDVTREELALCRQAETWAGQVREIVSEIRRAIAPPTEDQNPEATPEAQLLEDLRALRSGPDSSRCSAPRAAPRTGSCGR